MNNKFDNYAFLKTLTLTVQKERDLELAARIGQSLLKKNKTLSERNELLEEQVEHIREEVRAVVNQTLNPHHLSFYSWCQLLTCVFHTHTGLSAASWPDHERWAATDLHQCCWGEWGRVHGLHTVRALPPFSQTPPPLTFHHYCPPPFLCLHKVLCSAVFTTGVKCSTNINIKLL